VCAGTRFFCEILLFVGQRDSLSCKNRHAMKDQNVTACRLTSGKQRANSRIVIFIRCGTIKERKTCTSKIQLRNNIVKAYIVQLTGRLRQKAFCYA
jgi:hypothetical protein